MDVKDVSTYVVLSYLAHTLAKSGAHLVPQRQNSKLVRDWLSSAFGIALAFATETNIIADVGVALTWEPIGFLATGMLLGQGVKFGIEFLNEAPRAQH